MIKNAMYLLAVFKGLVPRLQTDQTMVMSKPFGDWSGFDCMNLGEVQRPA